MNKVTIYRYDENKPMRTLNLNGEPWFVLRDVCEVLGLGNSRMVADRLDEDEKGVSQIDTLGGAGLVDGLCILEDVTGLLLNLADGLHGGVLHAQDSSGGLGVDLLGIAAGQQLETSGTEQGAGSEQSNLLNIDHSSIPSFLSYSLMPQRAWNKCFFRYYSAVFGKFKGF